MILFIGTEYNINSYENNLSHRTAIRKMAVSLSK
jgi:hypothetical protein